MLRVTAKEPALPGKTVTHSGRGLRSALRFLLPKLAQAYTRGIRSTGSYFRICTSQIWSRERERVAQLAYCELIESVTEDLNSTKAKDTQFAGNNTEPWL